MEENQNYEEQNENTEKKNDKKNEVLKPVFIAVLIFLGAFCAFYVIADWYFKTIFTPMLLPPQPRHLEKIIEHEMKTANRMFEKEHKFLNRATNNIIHMEQLKNEYKITIDLKTFDDNKNNVEINTNGNILSISGRSIKKYNHNEHISEFQQNYMFGNNVQLDKMQKEVQGNKYIITIPIEENEEE